MSATEVSKQLNIEQKGCHKVMCEVLLGRQEWLY